MYKRILCALCFTLLLLFSVAMLYLILISNNHSKSQEVKDAPSISIYLVDLHNNSRGRISYGADKTVVIDRVELDLSYIGEKVKRKLLLFVCNATFPNQWKYNGFGSLQGKVHYRRDVPDFPHLTTAYYSTVIELSEISEFITGYYECVGFNKSDPVNGIYVFAPDKKNNTFINKQEEEIQVEINEPVEIRCPVSDPRANISLKRLILPYESGIIAEVELKNKNSFNPKFGFRFQSIKDIDANFSQGWGTYVCQDEQNERYSELVKVVKPLATIAANYSIESVTNRNGDQSVRVTCTSQENIYFEFYNFVSKRQKKVTHPKNDSHSIRARLHIEDFTNRSVVNCVTQNSYRILFSWKFKENGVLVGSSDIIIDYDEANKNFSCCSKGNESPKLKLLSCNTEAECQFKLNELKSSSYKDHELIANLTRQTNHTCTSINVERFSQGLLQCSMETYTKQILFYIDPESGRRRKKEPPAEGPDFIVQLEQKYTKIFPSQGKQIRFDCTVPRFFAAQGFHWELKKHSGASDYMKSHGVENFSKDLKEWIEIIVKDQQISKIICHAPAIGSSQFLTNSAVVNYTVFSALHY